MGTVVSIPKQSIRQLKHCVESNVTLTGVEDASCYLQRHLNSSLEGLHFFVHGPGVEFRYVLR